MRIMFPRDTDLAEGASTQLKAQRAGLFDTEADGLVGQNSLDTKITIEVVVVFVATARTLAGFWSSL